MRIVLVVAFLPFFLVAGCVGPQYQEQLNPRVQRFNESDLAPYAGKGNSTVVGEAFLKTRGGTVKKGAGETVWLVPMVPYLNEYVNREVIGNVKLTPGIEQQAYKYMRTTKADSEGRFRFDELQPGDYYVYALITWSVPHVEYGGYVSTRGTGGFAIATVTAKPDQQVSVVVTY